KPVPTRKESTMTSTEVLLAGPTALPTSSGIGGSFWASQGQNFLLAAIAIVVFLAVVALIMYGADLIEGAWRNRAQLLIFVGPALLLLAVGLIYPALDTTWISFNEISQEPDPETGINTTTMQFVGLDIYRF